MVEKSDREKSAPIELPSGVHTLHGCHRPWGPLILISHHFPFRHTCTPGVPECARDKGVWGVHGREKSRREKCSDRAAERSAHSSWVPHTMGNVEFVSPPLFLSPHLHARGPNTHHTEWVFSGSNRHGTPPDSQTKALMHRAPTASPRDGALATTPQSGGGAGGASRAPVQAEITAPCSNSCQGKSGSNGADRASSLRPKH